MATIRHIPVYEMPSLANVTKQLAWMGTSVANRGYYTILSTKEEMAQEVDKHKKLLNTLEKIGALETPEEKVIFTHLRMLKQVVGVDEATAYLGNIKFLLGESGKDVGNDYKEWFLNSKDPAKYIGHVTIPEFLAHYPEAEGNKIKVVARKVAKTIHENYFDLTMEDVVDPNFVITPDGNSPLRDSYESLDHFIDRNTDVIKALNKSYDVYAEFDRIRDSLIHNEQYHVKDAQKQIDDLNKQIKPKQEKIDDYQRCIDEEVNPSMTVAKKLLRDNIAEFKRQIQPLANQIEDNKQGMVIHNENLDVLSHDPHETLVDRMPSIFKR